MDLTEAESIKKGGFQDGEHMYTHGWFMSMYGKTTTKKEKRRGGKNTQKNYTKKIYMTQITTLVWSLT